MSKEAPVPTHCERCGMPPQNKQTRPLKEVDGEWTCDVCLKRNELPPAPKPVPNPSNWDV